MSIGEVCRREVVVIEKDSSVRAALKLMREHHVGDVVAVEERDGERVPVGILTDRDIVIEILAEDVDLDAVSVGDVMSFDLMTAQEESDVLETLKLMRNRGVRRVPIVNRRGGLVGILTLDDLLDLVAEQLNDLVKVIENQQKLERQIKP